MSKGSGGGGKSGRSGGGGSMNSQMMQNDIANGLLKGVQPGSRNEIKIKEMAASGAISQNRETGMWRAGPYEAKTAKQAASKVDYKPVGERISETKSDLANVNKKFPGFKFTAIEARLKSQEAERKSIYG